MRSLSVTACLVAVLLLGSGANPTHADWKSRAVTEAAEELMARFGVRAGRSLPALAGRIENLAARYGEEAIVAVRRGGPEALSLLEAAGAEGACAVRVLARHGEQGAALVVARPTALKQVVRYGEEAADVLVKHPGVAEPLVERGGAQAVQALAAVNPQNGRRVAMLLDGELAQQAGRHPEVLDVVAKHGDSAVSFLWKNKGVLAGGAALTVFLANPEPFLNGTRDLTHEVLAHGVEPVVGGVVTTFWWILGIVGALLLAALVLMWKYGPPSPGQVRSLFALFGRGH